MSFLGRLRAVGRVIRWRKAEDSQRRTLALPKEMGHWSLPALRERLVKIGAKVVRHGRYVTFQM